MSVSDRASAPGVGEIVTIIECDSEEEDGYGGKGYPGCLSKFGISRAKQVFRRASGKARRKFFGRSKKRRSSAVSSNGVGARKEGTRGTSAGGSRFGDRCCLSCIRRPKTLGSPVESVASDPNDPEFTHEMMRDLLEKNEFFSAECSTHMDAIYTMCDHGK